LEATPNQTTAQQECPFSSVHAVFHIRQIGVPLDPPRSIACYKGRQKNEAESRRVFAKNPQRVTRVWVLGNNEPRATKLFDR